MCGIFALLNNQSHYSQEFLQSQFVKGKSRGPEDSQLVQIDYYTLFGFHRLAINGLTPESNQPLKHKTLTLICNGEIYNYKELFQHMSNADTSVIPTTQSDCEVILWLYEKYGIEQCLQMLDGVFAFVLLDQSNSKIYVARDPYGVRPLYIFQDREPGVIGFASELKVLSSFLGTVDHFKPGTYSEYSFVPLHPSVGGKWTTIASNVPYHRMPFSTIHNSSTYEEEAISEQIRRHLISAVEKRCHTTERPIACLLSGGLDSSLIAALVCRYHQTRTIETYSIGLADSVDLKYARIVADYLGTKHTEIILSEQDFINAVPRVIQAIESYDTTTVRASIGNYLLGEYISKHSDAKVIFNGDGSDELLGGYLYMNRAPDAIEFDKECRRLLKDIHAFDVLRSDKSISSHGLEPRTPFLDRAWTQFYLSLPATIRYQPNRPEKYWLRRAFSTESLLPYEILWRRKEAFSDGVSGQDRSLFHILQESVEKTLSKNEPNMTQAFHNLPQTKEQTFYRYIFETHYPGLGNVVPYFWMPKYVEAKDASARTLALY